MIHFINAQFITAQAEVLKLQDENRFFYNLSGHGAPEQNTSTTQAAGQHGVTFGCTSLEQREIDADIIWNACSSAEQADLRRDLLYYFNPAQYQNHNGSCCAGCGCDGLDQDNSSYLTLEYCTLERDDCVDTIKAARWCDCNIAVTPPKPDCFTYASYGGGFVGNCGNCNGINATCGNPVCNNNCACVQVTGRRILYGAACCGKACNCKKYKGEQRYRRHVQRRIKARMIEGLAFNQTAKNTPNYYDIVDKITFSASPFFEDTYSTKQRVPLNAVGDFDKEVDILYIGDWNAPLTITLKGAFDTISLEHYGDCDTTLTLDYCSEHGETVTIDTANNTIYSDLRGDIPSAALVSTDSCINTFELIPPRPRSNCMTANTVRISGTGATLMSEVIFEYRNRWLGL